MPRYVARARAAVVAFLRPYGIVDPLLSDVELAVSECFTNVVYHAYVGERLGEVRVGVRLTDEHVELTVEDDGRGMRSRSDTPGLGLGLPIMATIAAKFVATPGAEGGTSVRADFLRP